MNQVDSHCHIWKLSRNDYHWMDQTNPDLAPIAKDFSIDDYINSSKSHLPSRIVLVQAAATEAETEFLLSIAESNPLVGAVVGWVDLSKNNVIASVTEFRKNQKFRGIRPMLQDIEDTDWLISTPDQNIWTALAKLNVCFDALIKPRHLIMIKEFCRNQNELNIVIDHAAKPQWPDSSFDLDSYLQHIEDIASNDHVYCKISGLLTELSQQQNLDPKKYVEPVVKHLIECFGSNRLMWGSDWPVINLVSDYIAWYEMCENMISYLPEADRQNIFANTAEKFYQLGEIA